MANTHLTRSLGLKESITLTVGTVIGVGLFTVGSNVVGTLGSITLLATFVAFLVSLYPALIYGEMSAAMPYEGGTYQYASKAINNFWGMQAGWSFVISLIAVASGEALAFAFYIKTLFEAIGYPLNLDDRLIATAAVLLFIIINWFGVKLAGKIQNGFMMFFWAVALVWFVSMIPNLNLAYYQAAIPFDFASENGISTFILATGLVWWCFAGFETCCSLGSEIKYPQVTIPRALFLAPFIVFIVTATFQWFLIGIVPTDKLALIAESATPYAEAMKQAGILGFPLIMLCLGIAFGGDLSTLNPTIAAPARYLFSMSKDGVLPQFLSRLHPKYHTPYWAILVMGIIIIGLITTNSIIYIASLSLFADLFYYVIGLVASIFLRIRYPHLPRPKKVPFLLVGALFSIVVYIILMSQLDRDAFITGAIWCVLGAIIYAFYRHKRKTYLAPEMLEMEMIPTETLMKLDREYRLWRNIVLSLFSLVIIVSVYFYVR